MAQINFSHLMKWRQTLLDLHQPSLLLKKRQCLTMLVLLNDAFTHAKHFGVKTAIGTESPLAFEPGNPTILPGGDPEHLITQDWIRTCPPFVQNRMANTYGYTIPTSRGATNETFARHYMKEYLQG